VQNSTICNNTALVGADLYNIGTAFIYTVGSDVCDIHNEGTIIWV
jgi:hypothetical protein